MRTTTATVRAGLAAAVLLVLAGCGGQTPPEALPSTLPPVPAATTSPTVLPTPSPEPTEPTEPSDTPTAAPVVNGPNSITAPAPGSTVEGPTVVVTGEGTAFEATLSYRVLAADSDEVVAEGFTMAGANGEIGPWDVELRLDPGRYTVQVWEPDVSDGESTLGPFQHLVETTFTVS